MPSEEFPLVAPSEGDGARVLEATFFPPLSFFLLSVSNDESSIGLGVLRWLISRTLRNVDVVIDEAVASRTASRSIWSRNGMKYSSHCLETGSIPRGVSAYYSGGSMKYRDEWRWALVCWKFDSICLPYLPIRNPNMSNQETEVVSKVVREEVPPLSEI